MSKSSTTDRAKNKITAIRALADSDYSLDLQF